MRTLREDHQPTRLARRFIHETLRGWGLNLIADDVTMAATELVTNALRYGRAAGGASTPQPVWMSLMRQGATLLCAVHDRGRAVPVVRKPDRLAESGRGLLVVASLSDSWGWTPPDHSGKTVWAVFSSRGPGARAKSAPR